MRAAPAALALALCGCGGDAGERPEPPAANRQAPAPPDSLALRAPDGTEVWFTLAREARSPDGDPCVERGLEIRREETRVPVPLLYTRAAPELVNDTTIRARLSNGCTPGDAYLVSLRSGRPIRER